MIASRANSVTGMPELLALTALLEAQIVILELHDQTCCEVCGNSTFQAEGLPADLPSIIFTRAECQFKPAILTDLRILDHDDWFSPEQERKT